MVVLHVLACMALILIVLLQTGKGAEMGAAFGGSIADAFRRRRWRHLSGKLTTGAAIVFMITCLGLTYLSAGPSDQIGHGKGAGRENRRACAARSKTHSADGSTGSGLRLHAEAGGELRRRRHAGSDCPGPGSTKAQEPAKGNQPTPRSSRKTQEKPPAGAKKQ